MLNKNLAEPKVLMDASPIAHFIGETGPHLIGIEMLVHSLFIKWTTFVNVISII
ncbi:MAG: hypothetical protein RL741_1198 [Actinomycetota bacterium]